MPIALTCLLFISLVLAACGGATESVSEESITSDETEESAQESQEATSAEETEAISEEPATEESEAANEEPAAEESVAEEAEATDSENPPAPEQELASSSGAECRTVTPENDPIAAVLQPNALIAPISDNDWAKGPADAPITVIEYGDFQ